MNHIDYLAYRRFIVFLDEWGLYLILLYTYFHIGLICALIVALTGGSMVLYGYVSLSELEDAYRIYCPKSHHNQLFVKSTE